MKKRILSLLMALCLLSGNCLTVFADETEPASQESTVETVVTETQEQPQPPQNILEETIPTQPQIPNIPEGAIPTQPTLAPHDDPEPPVLTQNSLVIDMDRQYPGMDKAYKDGYAGTVTENSLHFVLPLLNQCAFTTPINVTLNAGSLIVDEKKSGFPSESITFQDGQTVENVYLADFDIALPASVTPGSYPVKITVDIGDPAQAVDLPFSLNVVIPQPETPPTDPSEPTDPSNPTGPTNPTDPTNPTNPTEPTKPTEPDVPQIPTVLEIDNSHVYSGMDMAYEDGYLPRISDGVMKIVLPLKCSGFLWDDKLDTSISLDTSANSPFVVENFRKTFYLESVTPKNSSDPQDVYLVTYEVRLSEERRNGTYPVAITTSGFDASGNAITTTFTLYITITDGKIEKIPQPTVDTPTAEPVVYISKTVLEPGTAQAGEAFTMTVTLKNSITTKYVRNMLVTVDTGNVMIDLDEDSKIFPIDRIDRGGEVELTLHFSTEPAIPSGKYPISFSFKYDSSKTLNLSSTGATVVEIQQPANMELVMPRFADSVSVGETVPVTFQVMNMGRSSMYNVRCVVSGFGLVPSNTGYIGTMEAGTSKNTKVELYIIALNASAGNENGPQYGNTTGTVTLIYEDETGQEYSQEATFDTTVNRPVVQLPQSNTEEENEEQRVSSWWVSVSILGGVILAAVGTILFIRSKKRRGGNYL
mgnify:FL=1